MQDIVALVIPFIVLALFSVMIDKLTLVLEGIMNKIPRLPDHFEWYAAYMFVLFGSYLVCWRSDFILFSYLDLHFENPEEGYFLTALLISGGSAFVRTGFSMIETIPTSISGVTTTVKRLVSRDTKKSDNSTSNSGNKDFDEERFSDEI